MYNNIICPLLFLCADMKGWCERKESKARGFVAGAWHRRYLLVSEPGYLKFFKDADMEKV
jgi:hypothetical protein